VNTLAFCDRCGKERTADADHDRCDSAREFEPPRFCSQCGRRLVVQVVPRGWTARCSQHGTIA
jgi:hypothetical protein